MSPRTSATVRVNPGHEPGKLPLHLAGTGITTVLAGGIGQRALAHLQENGVTVIRGVSGDVNAAAAAYSGGCVCGRNTRLW